MNANRPARRKKNISAYSATGSRTPHAWRVQMRAGGKQFCRVLPFSRYGGREDALRWAVRLRDKVQAMLDMGAEPAWAFYIYGGAARPRTAPKVVAFQPSGLKRDPQPARHPLQVARALRGTGADS